MSIDQVVCISVEFGPDAHIAKQLPVLGGIYTIRGIIEHPYDGRLKYFLFEEIINQPVRTHDPKLAGEPAFVATNFRPVRKTDISRLAVVKELA